MKSPKEVVGEEPSSYVSFPLVDERTIGRRRANILLSAIRNGKLAATPFLHEPAAVQISPFYPLSIVDGMGCILTLSHNVT